MRQEILPKPMSIAHEVGPSTPENIGKSLPKSINSEDKSAKRNLRVTSQLEFKADFLAGRLGTSRQQAQSLVGKKVILMKPLNAQQKCNWR